MGISIDVFCCKYYQLFPDFLTKPCSQKLQSLTTTQVIEMTVNEPWAGCHVINVTDAPRYVCKALRRFKSSRERWWFVAVSRCDQPLGLVS